jgi:type IV fimbrial biogenesis protein FimT
MLTLHRPHQRFARGFTAIELMVTVAILAVLAALAAPSFTPLIERWRVRQVAEELQSTLYYARSEAIKRGGNISITRNSNAGACTSAGSNLALWSCGWTVVFSDPNNNGTQTSLQQTEAPSNTKVQLSSSQQLISIDRWGQFSISNFDFLIAPDSTNSTNAAKLCISAGGRIKRLDTGSSSCP